MLPERITWRESPGEHESLAVAVRAVLAAGRLEADFDDLCAALGTAFTAVSVDDGSPPGWWMTFGRDLFLDRAAGLYGLRLRALHPPEVGLDMTAAEEFPQHYEFSCLPLIEEALRHGQPVIAWQGWPGQAWGGWGVITGAGPAGLEGFAPGCGGQRVVMTGPAVQCYVVEELEPVEPEPWQIMRMAVRHADVFMNHAPLIAPTSLRPRIRTGPVAFDAWQDWLGRETCVGTPRAPGWCEHRQHAELVASARASALRVLQRGPLTLGPQARPLLADAAAACGALIEALAESRDPVRAEALMADPCGRETLLEAVTRAEAADRRLAIIVEELAGMLEDSAGPVDEP